MVEIIAFYLLPVLQITRAITLILCTLIYTFTHAMEGALPQHSTAYRIAKTVADKAREIIMRTTTPQRRKTRRRQTSANKPRNCHKTLLSLMCLNQWMVNQACVAALSPSERKVRFDSDSRRIGIDNRCSYCISGFNDDFIGELRETKRKIHGFNGSVCDKVYIGTLKWSWEDDQGEKSSFLIANSLYVPGCRTRLLSAQHWTQTLRPRHESNGTWTGDRECLLQWNKGKSVRTVPIDGSNTFTFDTAPGYKSYESFLDTNDLRTDPWESDELLCYDTGIVSDDESVTDERSFNEVQEGTDEWIDEPSPAVQNPTNESTEANNAQTIKPRIGKTTPRTGQTEDAADMPTTFEVATPIDSNADPTTIIRDEEDRQTETPTAQMLKLHYDYGHCLFKKLQIMARKGVIPKSIATCNIPTCTACEYARATKRPWRPKTSMQHNKNQPTRPGQVVSVDQLVSSTPGLIAQMSGFLTRKRYRYATVFVDQYSGCGYTHMQQTASAEETIRAKRMFEKWAHDRGVEVQHYHADNGVFKAKAWVEECERNQQGLTFAAVGAHHQNGKAERRIRELQETARAMLLHAVRRWPNAITAHLWPYAVRMANESINDTPSLQNREANE